MKPAATVLAAVLTGAALIPSVANSGETRIGDIIIRDAWTRETPAKAAVAAGYLRIENCGDKPERLVAADAAFAGVSELHHMSIVGGVMKMRQLPDGLEILPGTAIQLKPGSYHLMFTGLKAPVVKGLSIKVWLVLEKAGRVEVEFAVLPAGAPEYPGSSAADHPSPHSQCKGYSHK